ncbi:MAG: serine acetyltransferase, partial [Duncaniella sp.]|nr:serine acetyltransferase [Duncaniella sp.]
MLNAIRLYRLANWFYRHHIPLLPQLLQLLIFINYNCSVSYRMKIGKGTFFNHGGIGVLINPEATIGDDCKIGNNVSIVGQGPYKECPKIGNRVYIGPGAVVQGPVIIEHEVIIA